MKTDVNLASVPIALFLTNVIKEHFDINSI